MQAWKKHLEHTLCVTKLYAQLPKGGGGHALILLTFSCNFTVLATQRGGGAMAQWPLPKYAPVCVCVCVCFSYVAILTQLASMITIGTF